MLQTEVNFTLPTGYVDAEGTLHRDGVMRMATAADEIAAQGDVRLSKNPAYLTVIVLSRVITQLGSLREVDNGVVQKLFAKDVAFLQDLYNRINGFDAHTERVSCPECHTSFEHHGAPLGGSSATP